MRQLKHHESKLLRKVDLHSWASDASHREIAVMRRYHLQSRSDYGTYNSLCGSVRKLSHMLAKLPASDPFRAKYEGLLLGKMYDLGLVDRGAKMSDLEGSDAPDPVKGFKGKEKANEGAGKKGGKITVSAMCRRRLPVVLVRLKMAETIALAVRFVEQGHVRVGTDTITDPAFLVTRNMEDFVTWVDTSKLKRHVKQYNDELDDFDLMA